MQNGVGRDRQQGRLPSVGFGFISIPIDIDRDKFIQACYIKERVNILYADNPTIIKNCRIDKETMSQIVFPETYKEKGSFVVFVTHPVTGKPVIVGVLSKLYESQILEEFSWKKQLIYGKNMASIITRGKKGEICLTVDSDTEEGGNITINIKNQTGKGVFNVDVNGKANIEASDEINLKSQKKITLSQISYDTSGNETVKSKIVVDENSIEVTGDSLEFKGEKVILSDEKYKATRSEELKTQLDVLQSKVDLIINAINSGVVVPTDGGASFKASMITILQAAQAADFTKISSEKVYVD